MENRKTSLGMQALGTEPLAPLEPARGRARGDGSIHALGLGVTVLVHAAVGIALLLLSEHDLDALDRRQEQRFEAIEAGLAIKKKSAEGPKSKLPQKDEPPPVKPPDATKIATNPDVVPEPKPKKPREEPNPESVFDRFRKVDTRTTDLSSQEGADDGSEFGTLERAKGDPYVGELIGRMIVDFTVPSVVSDRSLKTWGCVKLNEDGRIVDRALDPDNKSRSHAFNSAVEERLRRTTDMEQPVPNHLKKMLVGKFVCATYTSRMD
jgi:hypothetical protein